MSDSVTPWTVAYPGSPVHGILQARILQWVIRGTSGEDSIARKSRVSIDNVHHATKKANKGVTTNKTKRKRTETDPEVSDVYQHIRGMPEESDANFTSSKRYLTKGKLSETQNRF